VNTPSTSVSPGLGGFLAFFLLAIALWLLMRNMNKRVRRMSYREEQEAASRAAEAAAARGEGTIEGPADGTFTNGTLADGSAPAEQDRPGDGRPDPTGDGSRGPGRTDRPGA
jgi:hypothetical protein